MPKKILVLEDEVMLSDLIRDEFTNAGFSVMTAKDGLEGLAMALKDKPDLMVVDILMPKMDGLTMLKNLRTHAGYAEVPAVILTNLNDTQTIQESLESGAYDYLVKSDWNPKDLVKHIKDKLTA